MTTSIYSASATLDEGMSFIARTGSGFSLVMDSTPDAGGQERGPCPMELVLVSLAGCTGMDVIAMLRKMRQHVTGYEVRVRGDERAPDFPKVYTRITVEHVFRGQDLDDAKVARSVELSATRYCPVSAMLGELAEVTHTYRIEEPVATE